MPNRFDRPLFGPRRAKAHTGVPADHFRKARDRWGDGISVLVADGPAVTLAALPVHHTDTSDGAWDGPKNEKNLSNDDGEDVYKEAYAWQDGDGDPDKKGTYAFIHHLVNADGEVGAASTKACSSAVAVLNGGRGVDVSSAAWADDRTGIYKHVVAHLSDSGVEKADLPELDDMAVVHLRSKVWRAITAAAPFEVSTAAEGLIVAIDAAVDELMEELGIPDSDDDEAAEPDEEMRVAAGEVLRKALAATSTRPVSARRRTLAALPDKADPTDLHAMTETQRRHVDAANEVTDPSLLAVMVASALSDRGITAAAGDTTGAPWHAYLCAEGIRTDDGRELCLNSCRFPDLPVSLRLLIEDEGGHWGAVTCGRIDTMERQEVDGLAMIYAEGVFGSDDNGQLAELMVTEQTQRFVSIDPRDVTYEWVEICVNVTDGYYGYDDDDDAVYDYWMRISDCVIGAATIVAMPALPQAVITLRDVALPDAPIANAAAPTGLVASGAPVEPPAEWFADPGFVVGDARLVKQVGGGWACPLTVTDDGRVFGHVAYWGAKHSAFPGRDVHPPRSKTDYAMFNRGVVVCADGTRVDGVGQVTMGCGHASTTLNLPAAIAHYDGGYGAVQVADVRAGQDDFGPWIAGSLRPGLTPEQVREFRALSLSGDWRSAGGNLEMVAVLAVPVPGFGISRTSLAASAAGGDDLALRAGYHDEELLSLVAAGRVQRADPLTLIAVLERRLDRLAAQVRPIAMERAGRV